MDENQENLGLCESAIKKCKSATNLFSQMLAQSVRLRRFDFVNDDGSVEEIENPRAVVSHLLSEVYQKKQKIMKQERIDMENKKTMQAISKQDLDTVKIPELYISAAGNNIRYWIESTYEKFSYVKKKKPQVMPG